MYLNDTPRGGSRFHRRQRVHKLIQGFRISFALWVIVVGTGNLNESLQDDPTRFRMIKKAAMQTNTIVRREPRVRATIVDRRTLRWRRGRREHDRPFQWSQRRKWPQSGTPAEDCEQHRHQRIAVIRKHQRLIARIEKPVKFSRLTESHFIRFQTVTAPPATSIGDMAVTNEYLTKSALIHPHQS